MVTRGRPLRRAAVLGAALMLAVTAIPAPGWAATGPGLDPVPIVWPDCFGRQYVPPLYADGQLVRPGTLGVIFAVPGVTTNGTAGDDLIIGTDGDDRIYGMAGDDTICGGDGADRIHGDDGVGDVVPGDDLIDGEDATDQLYGDGGNDVIHGGNNHPNSPYREWLQGDSGVDRLYGENGADDLVCGTLVYGTMDPGDLANGGTGMPGNQPENDHAPANACPLTLNVEYM
ncbi:calcium-binding protein [Dactylosporangium sp. NPDC049525]|uniref:calcium-binding protein n=1 Tax=Dactylosporangium sp. NPDC049525 TaxID=3154730 RepID=UPI00343FD78E